MLSLLLLAAVAAPLVCSFALAWQARRRGLNAGAFLWFAPCAGYGFVWLGWLLLFGPAYVLLTLFSPAREELLHGTPTWFVLCRWLVLNESLLTALLCIAASVWLVRSFWPDWQRIPRSEAIP